MNSEGGLKTRVSFKTDWMEPEDMGINSPGRSRQNTELASWTKHLGGIAASVNQEGNRMIQGRYQAEQSDRNGTRDESSHF